MAAPGHDVESAVDARRRWLWALAALALGVRLAAVVAVADRAHPPYTFEHGQIAANLLAGRGFSIRFLGVEGPTSQQAPCYPILLAAIEGLFGAGFTALVVVQVLQALAGAATVVLLALLAARWLPGLRAAGPLAGLLLALHPTQVYAVTQIQPAVWITLILMALLWAASRPVAGWRWQNEAACGALGGLLLLWEPILALALPVVALMRVQAHWTTGRELRRAAVGLGVMVAASIVVVAPWLARNALVHGELVFVKSTFGYAFWQGNNPASHGTDKVPSPEADAIRRDHDGSPAGRARALEQARLATRYIDDVALTPADYGQLAALGEPARCRLLLDRAVEFIRSKPGQYARLCAARLRYFLLFDETNPRAASAVFRITTVVWLVLGLTGFVASLLHWRTLWPGYAIFAAVTLFHTLTIASVRFRLPIEPVAWVWAAAALAPLAVHLRRQRQAESEEQQASLPEGTRVSEPHSPLRGPHRLPQEQPAAQPRRKAG